MTLSKLYHTLLFTLVTSVLFAQTGKITGVVLDEKNQPIEGANITFESKTVTTDNTGFYVIEVPANQRVLLVFNHVAFKKITAPFEVKPKEVLEFNPVMDSENEQLEGVVITGIRPRARGILSVTPEVVRKIPGLNGGVENVLKIVGASSNSDMSSQYSVRGGNYDENLVYVNEIEVYRPFLIRSGQQEGLSFVNSDLIQKIDFYAGGFEARFGDKMSSVLDITYQKPKEFGASMDASFLGGAVSAKGISKDKMWNAIGGLRYRDNSLLVNSQETQTNFRPRFWDGQFNLNYTPSEFWNFSFLGNASSNRYNYQPLTRQTNFGTLDEPIALQVFYEGQEDDRYQTLFGAFKSTFTPNDNNNYRFIASAYHTQEQEYFDIDASYFLGEVDANIGSETFGNVTFNRAIGSQLNHARNNLDALIFNAEVKGSNNQTGKHRFEWGLKYTHENIRDRIVEWEVIDSAGFSINPPVIDIPVDQPYNPYVGPLVPFQNVRETNFISIDRISGFAQWNTSRRMRKGTLYANAGMRWHSWMVSGRSVASNRQTVFSPRLQLAYKLDNKDMLFRLATGYYYQPPFYRELRDQLGVVNPDVKAQQSLHFVLANDYGFSMWKRPFRLVTELYYKDMQDVNTYTLENVRIRYRANNDAVAYTYGMDVRLHGEFVKGTESWFTFGYMKAEENQNNRGYIARPTDQRLKFGILFQDYMPNIPNLKIYMNIVYNTGLPGGSPSYADAYTYQTRLRDYRRADVGFFYVFTEKNGQRPDGHWLKKFKDLSLGVEIFNMFNNQNAITNTWVRDAYTKNQFGIPNYMTTRVFNMRLSIRL